MKFKNRIEALFDWYDLLIDYTETPSTKNYKVMFSVKRHMELTRLKKLAELCGTDDIDICGNNLEGLFVEITIPNPPDSTSFKGEF